MSLPQGSRAATDVQMDAVADILRIVSKFERKEAIEITAIVAGITWEDDRWESIRKLGQRKEHAKESGGEE